MTEAKVAGKNEEFNNNDSRIDVPGAMTIIGRATDRLTFLSEVMFNDDLCGSASWWSLRDLEAGRTKDKDSMNERSNSFGGACDIVLNAQRDLERVYALIYPDEAAEWLREEVQGAKKVKWVAGDVSCQLAVPIDVLTLLYDQIFSSIGVIPNFSHSALMGLKTVICDVHDFLKETLSELEECTVQ